MDILYQLIEPVQSWLFEILILPIMHVMGISRLADEAFDAVGNMLLGLMVVVISYLFLRPLEALRPVEAWQDRKAVRVDIIYTFLMRSGILPLTFFILLDPVFTRIQSSLHMANVFFFNVEDVFPALQDKPFTACVVYVVIFDFFEYLRHRMQHRFDWWWGLHCVHHSQRQLSLWSDERNHVLDSLIKSLWLSVLALLIGVPGVQFLFIVLFTKFIESLSHTNVALDFGGIGSKILVSPAYHRLHHAIGTGHTGKYYGCNFATLFPLWDIIFRTANFSTSPSPTGIQDQLEGEDYGQGFFRQQYIGFRRMFTALKP